MVRLIGSDVSEEQSASVFNVIPLFCMKIEAACLSGTVASSRYCGFMCQKTNCNILFLENLKSRTVLRFAQGSFI